MKYLIKINFIIFISLFIILNTKCTTKNNNSEVDDTIILKIGQFEVTKYEFDKNKERGLDYHSVRKSEDWLNSYIANSYFLADAYNKEYDTITEINKKVYYGSVTLMGQFKGYLWNTVEEPKLVFKKKILKKVYRKRKKEFDLEYLVFQDTSAFNKTINQDSFNSSKINFKELTANSKNISTKYVRAKLLYPFGDLESIKDKLWRIKRKKMLVTPLDNGQILVTNIIGTNKVTQNKFSIEKDKILKELIRLKERQIIIDKQNSIFKIAKIKFNEKTINLLLRELKDTIPLIISRDIISDTLLTYKFYGLASVLIVRDFLDYYNFNPIMYLINSEKTMKEMLYRIIEEKYLFEEGINLGIVNGKRFILDKKDYLNRLILIEYFNKNFRISEVNEKDIYEYYKSRPQEFIRPKKCKVSIFTFKNLETALISRNLVSRFSISDSNKKIDTSRIGLISFQPNVSIESENNYYPTSLIYKIFTSEKNITLGPFKTNDQIQLFIKTSEEGQDLLPLEIIKEPIRENIITKRKNELIDLKFKELKSKYIISICNIKE